LCSKSAAQHFLTSQSNNLNAAKASLFLISAAQFDIKPSVSVLQVGNTTSTYKPKHSINKIQEYKDMHGMSNIKMDGINMEKFYVRSLMECWSLTIDNEFTKQYFLSST
jgi:hypothetical protein